MMKLKECETLAEVEGVVLDGDYSQQDVIDLWVYSEEALKAVGTLTIKLLLKST